MEGIPFPAPWASFLGQMDTCDRRPAYAPLPSPERPGQTGPLTHRQHSPAPSGSGTSSRSRSTDGSVRGFGGRAMARSARRPAPSETLCQRRAPRSPSLLAPRLCARGCGPPPPPAASRPSSSGADTLPPGSWAPPSNSEAHGRTTPLLLLWRRRRGWGRARSGATASACKRVLYPSLPTCGPLPTSLRENSAQDNCGSCRWRVAIWGVQGIIKKSTISHLLDPHPLQEPQVKSCSKS